MATKKKTTKKKSTTTKKKSATKSPEKKKKTRGRAKRLNAKDASPLLEQGMSRMRYIAEWKKKRDKDKEKAERRLNSYVDRLVKKYPEEYLEKIKEGLENEDKFKETMEELEMEAEDNQTDREFLERLSRAVKLGD